MLIVMNFNNCYNNNSISNFKTRKIMKIIIKKELKAKLIKLS